MISYVSGNLFESPAQTLVNTVNTVGVMGKGIALTFKKIYPDMYERYREACDEGHLRIGSLFVWRTPNKLVLNFPTKEDWRRPSKASYIEAGLRTFVRSYESIGIRSVAFPPLGCGNGELDFDDVVRPMMERYLRDLPIPVFIYAPHAKRGLPEHRDQDEICRWLRSEPRELAFREVWADLSEAFVKRTALASPRGAKVEAQYIPEADGLRIWASGRTSTFAREDYLEIWKQLRISGYVTTANVPVNRGQDASNMLTVLAVLPYIQPVALGEAYDDFNFNPLRGLQLMPRAVSNIDQQRELSLAK